MALHFFIIIKKRQGVWDDGEAHKPPVFFFFYSFSKTKRVGGIASSSSSIFMIFYNFSFSTMNEGRREKGVYGKQVGEKEEMDIKNKFSSEGGRRTSRYVHTNVYLHLKEK